MTLQVLRSDPSPVVYVVMPAERWWVKHPKHPELNVAIEIDGDSVTWSAPRPTSVRFPANRSYPTIQRGIRQGKVLTFALSFATDRHFNRWADLLDTGDILLLQAPNGEQWWGTFIADDTGEIVLPVARDLETWRHQSVNFQTLDIPNLGSGYIRASAG